jgi:cobaltochelatase CobS
MAAQKSPIINSVDDSGIVTFIRGGMSYTRHYAKMDKIALIAVAKHLGFRFTGVTPMRWDLTDIIGAVANTLEKRSQRGIRNTQPNPQPKVDGSKQYKEVPMSQPKVEQAVQDLLNAVQNLGSSSVDIDTVRNIVNDVTSEPLSDLKVQLMSLSKYVSDNAEDIGSVTETVDGLTRSVSELTVQLVSMQPKITKVIINDRIIKELHGVQHAQFPKVLSALGMRCNMMLVGPAGTGKTTIASNASEALGLAFSSKSCTSQTTESSLVGFINATGHYVTTEFRKRFEDGGVFLLDEVDNANPNVLGVLNSALANGTMAFPDGMVKRHTDFVCIAAGNTYGNGATAEYVGRNPIDAATKDRFVFLDIHIDEMVEQAMLNSVGLDAEVSARWLNVVRTARRNVGTYGLKVVVSPRATMYGASLLKAGWVMQDVVDATVLKGAKPDQQAKILEGVTI